MKKIMFLFLGLLSFILSGCTAKKVYVPVQHVIYVPVPDHLVKDDIVLPRPPDRKKYILADPIQRENILTIYILNLYKIIGKYKLKLKAIRDYNKKIKKKR